jgi:hypothetical protein
MAEDWAMRGSGVRVSKGKKPQLGKAPLPAKRPASEGPPLEGKREIFSQKCDGCGEKLSAEIKLEEGGKKTVSLGRVTVTTNGGGSKAYCDFGCAP